MTTKNAFEPVGSLIEIILTSVCTLYLNDGEKKPKNEKADRCFVKISSTDINA